MEARDFYITLQSDSNPNYFTKNTITDFRNRFSPPIKLDGEYEVALVECTYVHSDVIVEKDEKICTYNGVVVTAHRSYTSIENMLRDLAIPGLSLVHGSIVDDNLIANAKSKKEEHTSSDDDLDEFEGEEALDDSADILTNRIKKTKTVVQKLYKPFRSYEQSTFASLSFHHPSVPAHMNRLNFKWEPKIATIINPETKAYDYAAYSKTGITEMFVYCDIVHLKRVGGGMVPLINNNN